MNLDQLQKIAEEATPGPWETDGHGLGIYPSLDGKSGPALCALMSKSGAYDNHEANAAHIAAASPDVVLRLIAVARAAKQADDDMRDSWWPRTRTMDALRSALAELEGA